jgi:cysteinyl-tRNA synthetase
VLFDLAHEINRLRNEQPNKAAELAGELVSLGNLLGLLGREPDAFLQASSAGELSAEEIEQLIAERKAARAARDFQRADEIRDELQQQGVVLEDSAAGTTWRRT